MLNNLFFPVLEDGDGEKHGHVENCSRGCHASNCKTEPHEDKKLLASAAKGLHKMLREK